MKAYRLPMLAPLLTVLLGCQAPSPEADGPMDWAHVPVSIQGRLAEQAPSEGLIPAMVVGEPDTVYLHPDVRFGRDDVRWVQSLEEEGVLVLQIWFTDSGADRIARITAEQTGHRFALLVNGNVVSAPEIVQPVRPDPSVPVAVEVGLEEPDAARLAEAIARTWPPGQGP